MDIESALDAVAFTRGVVGVVVCNMEGIPIRDTFKSMDRSEAIAYAQLAAELTRSAASILKVDPESHGTEGVRSLRVRATNLEIFIRTDGAHLLVVLQDPDSV